MFDQQPTIELLFKQLGLEASADAIDRFIETQMMKHKLSKEIEYDRRNYAQTTC